MSIEINAIKHSCNIIRRQVQAEFPDLTLFFLPYTHIAKGKAIDQEEGNIMAHPAGADALKHFRRHKRNDKTGFLGLATATRKSLFRLRKKTEYMALIYIDVEPYETIEESRRDAYHYAWHAIALYQHHKNKNIRKVARDEELLIPRYENLDRLSHNMTADTFTAIILDLQNEDNHIEKIAKERALDTVNATVGSRPELYPFPIAFEATRLVYDELKDLHIPGKNNALSLALQMAHEVDVTHPENTLRQWQIFSAHAQEMAWLNYSHERILSAGCYTSEDPYVRTTAYIIAEILELEPEPWTDFKVYNPFTEEEMNERSHVKACEHLFKNLSNQLANPRDGNAFHLEAAKQNKALMKGHVLGWCVPALLEAAAEFPADNLETLKERAAEAFHDGKSKIRWHVLSNLSKEMMQAKRRGDYINSDTFVALAEKNIDYQIIRDMLGAAPTEAVTQITSLEGAPISSEDD